MLQNRYSYSGPVLYFDKCVCTKWNGTTFASSEKKARSNLAYRFKKENNMMPNARIILPEKIIVED
jgi:hypothetical protein